MCFAWHPVFYKLFVRPLKNRTVLAGLGTYCLADVVLWVRVTLMRVVATAMRFEAVAGKVCPVTNQGVAETVKRFA